VVGIVAELGVVVEVEVAGDEGEELSLWDMLGSVLYSRWQAVGSGEGVIDGDG